jgi:hypothetical protein
VGQLVESGVPSDGKDREWYMDIRGSKVVDLTCVDWGLFVVDPWMSIWLCIDRMPDLWGPVNRRSSMIVVVGWYLTIPLEMSTGIVYGPSTYSSACGITCKTCTRERWDLDRPYNIVAKGCHTWPIRGCAYVVFLGLYPCRVGYWFGSPWHSRIWVTACSLPPLVEMHVLIIDDEHDYYDDIFTL